MLSVDGKPMLRHIIERARAEGFKIGNSRILPSFIKHYKKWATA